MKLARPTLLIAAAACFALATAGASGRFQSLGLMLAALAFLV